jgi:hypothetical protein
MGQLRRSEERRQCLYGAIHQSEQCGLYDLQHRPRMIGVPLRNA